jgi:hypothetical protein
MKKAIPLGLCLVLSACTTTGSPSIGAHTPTASPSAISVPANLLNPNVTQDTIDGTICKTGWTTTVRPPVSYTNALKRSQLPSGADLSLYEEDHWIPLELGGAPRTVDNLWPEPIDDARKKDVQENALHKAVCNSTITLEQAREQMYHWRMQ